MRISKKRKKIFILAVALLAAFSLNFFQKEAKGFFYSFSSPFQKEFWEKGNKLSDFFEGVFLSARLKSENENLRGEFHRLLAENASLRNLEEENIFLREALELGLQEDFRLQESSVIGRDAGSDGLVVDKGFKDGISQGMVAITSQKVLLGRVGEVYDNYSRIELISSKESSFGAEVSESGISGVAKGRGGSLRLEFLPKEDQIKAGDPVFSSALGGTYPQGLPVGLIEKVESSDTSSFQEAEVSLFFDLPELEYVFLITDH